MPSRRDTWDRWARLWHAVVATSVVLASAFTAAMRPPARPAAVLLGASLLLLIGAVVARERRRGHLPPALASAFIVSTMVLALSGTWLHPIFLSVAGCLVAEIFTLLPIRWALPHAAALAVAMTARTHSLGAHTASAVIVVAMLFGSGLALYIASIIAQSQERARLIAELEATRAELALAEREAGVMAERQRVSHEIHDTLTQDLISIVRSVEQAERALAPEAEDVRAHLLQAQRAARDGLEESRRLVWSMRPAQLENATLGAALERVVERFRAESGVSAELVVEGELARLPPAVEVTLLRVAQEALQNVAKHARARAVTVTLTELGDRVMLDVHDDGEGFMSERAGTPAPAGGGFGLIAMRERVQEIGGVVEVESAPGEGTTIGVQVPVAHA